MEETSRELTGRRFKFDSVEISRLGRVRIWATRVWLAIKDTPPKTRTIEVAVNPGEPGYADAPMVEVVTTYSLGSINPS